MSMDFQCTSCDTSNNEEYLLSDMNTELGSNAGVMSSDVVRIAFELADESQDSNSNYACEPCELESSANREDGVERRKKRVRVNKTRHLTIAHDGGTPLELVGRQIWRGCLLMSDFILFKRDQFQQGRILELGTGVGVVGVVCDMILKEKSWCYITDYDDGALSLSLRNLKANCHLSGLVSNYDRDKPSVCVRRYDWHATHLTTSANSQQKISEELNWKREDVTKMKEVEFILCADCVYDEVLTNALFKTIRHILKTYNRKAICYLTLEKRYNFEMSSLSVQAHGYRCFLSHIGQLPSLSEEYSELPRLTGRTIPLSALPQFFHYKRCPQLEMWEIRAKDD